MPPRSPKATPTVADRLKKIAPQAKAVRRSGPLWAGPAGEGPQGGVTFSLLSRYLVDKERFRLMVVEGLKPKRTWNHRTGYGDMWHVCEEALAAGSKVDAILYGPLTDHCREQCKLYPTQQEEIDKWYNVCKVQFPEYIRYWETHEDVKGRTPLFQEQPFDVPYRLPGGRKVRLRGKWDSVDVIGPSRTSGIYLQENKTKGDVREGQLKRQLTFDLQTMLYLIALCEGRLGYGELGTLNYGTTAPVVGVRYNVVRRPLSGGKGSITRHKPSKSNPQGEGKAEFFERLRRDYIAAEPETYFMRWRVDVLPADRTKFQRECLDPVLENLLDDYEWWGWCAEDDLDPFAGEARRIKFPDHTPRHFRYPFGVYNVLAEGGETDMDEFLATGSELGLTRVDNLFPELQ